jgi:protein ImuB
MTVSAAIALAPQLRVHRRDAAAEREALAGIANWAGQFTPVVSLSPPHEVLLEVEGSLRLFDGLHSLLLRLDEGVMELGYSAAIAVAPTPGAARLLARAGLAASVTDTDALKAALAPLPLALLDQPADTIRMLAMVGIRTLGDCLQLPRDGLARRFGQSLLDELDRALNRLPDPRKAYQPPARYRTRLVLPAPLHESEPLLFAARRLIVELAGYLRMKQAGVTRLQLTLQHEDRPPTLLRLAFSTPSRDALRILRLLRERLMRLQLPARVEAIQLDSKEARPLQSQNLSLFPEHDVPEEQRWSIIDHLRARLGVDAVYSVASYPDPRPEGAWRACEPGAATPRSVHAQRPLWLLEPPRKLLDREDRPVLEGPLTLMSGPERIEGGWWDGNDVARDYFVARDERGRCFWIYRQRQQDGWFLQGIFS